MDSIKVFVLYENEEWLPPLVNKLRERQIAYETWFLHLTQLDLTVPPPHGIFFSRCSASSGSRNHRESIMTFRLVLSWLHKHRRTVVNGLSGLELEISKVNQYLALQAARVLVPSYRVIVGGASEVQQAIQLMTYPVIVKPNCGGKGLGVFLLRNHEELESLLVSDDFVKTLSLDCVTIAQQYIASPEPRITRVELIGGKFLYAMYSNTSSGFQLCPADACEKPGTNIQPFVLRRDLNDTDPLIQAYASFMHQNNVDIAGFEYIEDAQGQRYTYDVNVSTNYSAKVQADAGVDFYDILVDFLLQKATQQNE